MSSDEIKIILDTIEGLKSRLSGNMIQDMNIREEIHNLEMKLNGTKPIDSHMDCFGCGS